MNKFGLRMGGLSMMMMAMAAQLGRADSTGWNMVTEEDAGAALTHVQFVIRSGSLSDPATKPGLAYFTARALLRGTQTRPFQDLNNEIESLGGAIAVSVDQTETVFDATVLTQNLDAFLDLLRDIFTNPAFNVSDMNLLQKILFGELRDDLQDTQTLASRALMQTAYAGLQAQYPPHGTIGGISQITPQDAVGFFSAHYVRENLIIATTSPMTRADLVAELQLKLDPIPHGVLDAAALPNSVIKGHGFQAVIVNREGLSTIPIFIGMSGASDADSAMPGLEVGNFVFGGDFTSRLMQVLRVQNGWTYGVSSGYQQTIAPKAQPGLFSIYLFPSTQFFEPCLMETLTLLQSYASSGLTGAEFKFGQSALSNSYPFQLDSAQKRLGWDVRTQLTGRPSLTSAQYTAQINGLNLATVNASIAAENTQDALIVVVGDAATLQPVLTTVPGVRSVNVIQVNP